MSAGRAFGRRPRSVLVAAAAPAPLAALLAGLRHHQHRVALLLARLLEARPPLSQLPGHLAARRAQQQEVVRRAEALVHERRERTPAAPLLEARLHGPDLLHDRGEAARAGELGDLDV